MKFKQEDVFILVLEAFLTLGSKFSRAEKDHLGMLFALWLWYHQYHLALELIQGS